MMADAAHNTITATGGNGPRTARGCVAVAGVGVRGRARQRASPPAGEPCCVDLAGQEFLFPELAPAPTAGPVSALVTSSVPGAVMGPAPAWLYGVPIQFTPEEIQARAAREQRLHRRLTELCSRRGEIEARAAAQKSGTHTIEPVQAGARLGIHKTQPEPVACRSYSGQLGAGRDGVTVAFPANPVSTERHGGQHGI